jgi:hypothetical protein
MTEHTMKCPGCGVEVDSLKNKPDDTYNAIIGCREMVYELSYYTLSLGDSYFLHQLVVDTYAAQHAGPHVKAISTAFALVGLYIVNVQNKTGRDSQLAHIALANKSKTWPMFEVPQSKHWMTVKDVLALPDIVKEDAIKQWSSTVWDVWRPHQHQIEQIFTMQ